MKEWKEGQEADGACEKRQSEDAGWAVFTEYILFGTTMYREVDTQSS